MRSIYELDNYCKKAVGYLSGIQWLALVSNSPSQGVLSDISHDLILHSKEIYVFGQRSVTAQPGPCKCY